MSGPKLYNWFLLSDEDDAELQKFSLFIAGISRSFKFNLSNLNFHFSPFLVYSRVIHVRDYGVNQMGSCPFHPECKCAVFLCGITMLDLTFGTLGKAVGWHNLNGGWNAVNSRLNVSFISLGFSTYVRFNLRIHSADETSMTSQGESWLSRLTLVCFSSIISTCFWGSADSCSQCSQWFCWSLQAHLRAG